MGLKVKKELNYESSDSVPKNINNRSISCNKCNGSGQIPNKFYQKCHDLSKLGKEFHKCDPDKCLSCTIAKRCKPGVKTVCKKCQGTGETKSSLYFNQFIRPKFPKKTKSQSTPSFKQSFQQDPFYRWVTEKVDKPPRDMRTRIQKFEDYMGITSNNEEKLRNDNN